MHPWFSPLVEQRDSRTTAAAHIPELDIPPTALGVLHQPGTCLHPRLPHTLLFLFPGIHDMYCTGQTAHRSTTQSLKVENAKAFCVFTAQFAFWTFVNILIRILISVTWLSLSMIAYLSGERWNLILEPDFGCGYTLGFVSYWFGPFLLCWN